MAFAWLSSLFKKEQSVLGIDIGSSAVKVVQIKKRKGKVTLETYGELALGPYGGVEVGRATNLPPEKIVEAINDILRESSTTTRMCGIAIPLSSSLITFITIPTTDQRRISDIVTLEARKYIPVPISEVMLDWSIIPKENSIPGDENASLPPAAVQPRKNVALPQPAAMGPSGTDDLPEPTDVPAAPHGSSEVLVIAIHNEAISGYQDISARTALQTSFYELELFSSLRAVLEHGIAAQMVMDVGASTTKLYIIERGLLRASHIINRGSQDITLAISKALSCTVAEAENLKRVYGMAGGAEQKELADIISLTLDYVLYEANRVLLGYQRKTGHNISKIILTGGGSLLKGFTELAGQSFQNEVVYARPFNKLETPAFLADQFKEAGPEFAVAIGVALRRLAELN
jgi:type IV pilus assembly protein PilM